MNQPTPSPDLGTHNHWRRVLWVILIILMVMLARRMAGAADIGVHAHSLISNSSVGEAARTNGPHLP